MSGPNAADSVRSRTLSLESPLRVDEPEVARDRLAAVGTVQFAQDRAHMALDGSLGDHELLCDPRVSRAGGNDLHDVDFASGQDASEVGRWGATGRAGRQARWRTDELLRRDELDIDRRQH